MARPAPDPERVMAVYELAVCNGLPYRRVVQELAERGETISIGTVSEWVRQGHQWWAEVERLTYEQEYGLHRNMIGTLFEWLRDASTDTVDVKGNAVAAEIGRKDAIELGLKILDRHAALTGVDAVKRVEMGPIGRQTISPEQRAATEALRRKVQGGNDRRAIEG